MSLNAPVIETRDRAKLLSSLLRQLPGYLPGSLPADPSSSRALLRIFAGYLNILAEGVNQVPERSLMAFLDMLGAHLLPAQAAQAPLVFTLLDNAPVDVTLPENSLVAAPARPAPPSPLQPDRNQTPPTDAIFATRQAVTLARARLSALYSIHPGSDEYADHTADLTKGFTLFDGLKLTEHAIYLGHDELFALGGENIVVMLSFSLDRFASLELKTQWEYLTEGGWSPLESAAQDDTTGGLRHDGVIMLRRESGPKAKQAMIENHTSYSSYWLRGWLTTPLLPDGPGGKRTVPLINDIRARVGFKRTDIAPEAAFLDTVPLDISKDFHPFGQQPVTFTTFYLACKEVFQRKGATVEMKVNLSPGITVKQDSTPKLTWEYSDGSAWQELSVRSNAASNAFDFTSSATVSFNCPRNWAEMSVNGAKNYWLRVRITTGDYGQPFRGNLNIVPEHNMTAEISGDRKILTIDDNRGYVGGEFIVLSKGKDKLTAIVADTQEGGKLILRDAIPGDEPFGVGWKVEAPAILPGNLQPPVVKNITLAFTYLSDPFELDHCLSNNDFVFEDHTEDARWPARSFTPFRPVADAQPTVHFGFDRRLPTGLISLYVDVQQETDDTPRSSPFVWEYRSECGWNELGVLDETLGFRHSGMIQFIGQPDAASALGLGDDLFRVRARLKQGESMQPLPVAGIWLNAIWADQRTAPAREELGSSDGNPGQTFTLQRKPVLAGEIIEVQEWRGRGEGWRTTLDDIPERDRRFEHDPASGTATAVWVTWHEQTHLHHSHAGDRHYILERVRGLVRFGDNKNGLEPPAGSRIVITYSSGGGVAGNLPAGEINELRMAFPFVQTVTNPIPASGGADIETTEAVKRRGPQRLRHHDRALSVEDCEWLARQASSDVARVRCLPITGPAGHAQRGWITLIVAPFSPDPQPQPSSGFRQHIRDALARRVPATVSRHVRITGPQYTPVRVQAEIIPHAAGQAALVEAQVRDRLNRFLHPLSGGANGQGWAFGQAVYLSQIARVIEEIPGVDYAREVRMVVDERIFADVVPIDTYALVAAGNHELKLTIGVA